MGNLSRYEATGLLDEVRLFNSTLSSSQITNLYNLRPLIDVDLNKVKITYTTDQTSGVNITTADGVEISKFFYNGLGLTNIQNETFGDLSDGAIKWISRWRCINV